MNMSVNRSGGDNPWNNVSITVQFAPPGGQPGMHFQNPFGNDLLGDDLLNGDLLDHEDTPAGPLHETSKSPEPANAAQNPLQSLAEGGLLKQVLQLAFLLGLLKQSEKSDPDDDIGNRLNDRQPPQPQPQSQAQPESRGRFDTPPEDWCRTGGTERSSKNSGGQRPSEESQWTQPSKTSGQRPPDDPQWTQPSKPSGQRPSDDPKWTQPSTDGTSTEKGKGSSKGDKPHATDKEHHVSDKEKPSTTRPVDGPDDTGKTGKVGPTSMPAPTGEVTVNKTIVVKAGEVFDGGGKLYKGGSGLGDGGQAEGQKPIFQIEPGGSVKNLQYAGADGIHTYGDATIKDVWARDVGEDAMTMKGPGNVKWTGGGAFDANDKIFQLNAGGSFTLENFTADGFGKAVRTNGGKQIDTDITIRNSHFENGKEAIARTDSASTRIKLEGVTFNNVPNDVLAPEGNSVIGAVKRGSKAYSG